MDYQQEQRVVIIGGGIAGLSTAWYVQKHAQLHQQSLHITIVERDQRVGGKLVTDTISLPDAAEPLVVEGGPDAFITQKPWGLQLVQDLSLSDQLISTQPARHKVFVLHHGKPHPLPDGVNLVVPTQLWPFVRSPIISWRGKLRMALDLVLPARKGTTDETLASFIGRRFGAEALDKIAEPLMAGIHNAESQRQSLLATFPRFRDVEIKYGSLIRGMRAARTTSSASQPTSPFISLRGGIQTLVDALVRQISATIRTGCQVVRLDYNPTNTPSYHVHLDTGEILPAEAVVLAVPAFVAGELVAQVAPALAAGLGRIRYVTTGTVSLAFRRSDIGVPLDSYGLVIPASEQRRINAVTISSRKFAHRAPDEYILLRVFVGGSRHPEVIQLADEALLALVQHELQTLLGIDAAPVWQRIYRWPRANPQYDVGHLDRVAELEQQCPARLYLCGSAYRGVGIPDCVRQGQETAARVFAERGVPELI